VPFKTASDETTAEATTALVRLAELTIDAFPATIVPSPLVTELDALAREAGLELPLVEELAADIFMGSFSAKFLEAAKLAGHLLQGSPYERYFDIDYALIHSINDVQRQHRHAAPTSPTFDAYCVARAGGPSQGWSIAANGTVIEQAQILTTHNLATLTGPFGVGEAMNVDWPTVARMSFDHELVLANRLRSNPRPLRTIKDLAYAWRQTIFFVARMDAAEAEAFLAWTEERLTGQPNHVVAVMSPVVRGLRDVVRGRSFDADGMSENGRQLLGWTVGRHWILETADVGRRAAL
jgi:hypothetical protein